MPFNFNKNEEVGDVEAPQTGSTKFCRIGMIIRNFVKGGPVTFPGIFEDDYNNDTKESTRIGQKEFHRQPLDKKVNLDDPTMCIIVMECERDDGETYQIIKQCDNYLMENGKVDENGKKETVNFFKTFQYPELLAAEGEGALDALGNADAPERWVYGQATFLDSGIPTEWSTRKYPGNFVIYSDEKTWRAASEKFFIPAGEREEDTWISHALQDDLEQRYPDWQELIAMQGLGYLKEQALKYADTAPALLKGKMGMSEKLAVEIINAAKGIVPKEIEVTPKEMPF